MSDDEMSRAAPVWRRAEPDSPCIALCSIHPSAKICVGCGRTADEIAGWIGFSAEERAEIRAELPARFDLLKSRENRPSRRRRQR